MVGSSKAITARQGSVPPGTTACGGWLILGAPLLGACAGMSSFSNRSVRSLGSGNRSWSGNGQFRWGMIRPLSRRARPGVAAAIDDERAEMALRNSESQHPASIKDDDRQSARCKARQRSRRRRRRRDHPGSLFDASRVRRTADNGRRDARGVPVIAFPPMRACGGTAASSS